MRTSSSDLFNRLCCYAALLIVAAAVLWSVLESRGRRMRAKAERQRDASELVEEVALYAGVFHVGGSRDAGPDALVARFLESMAREEDVRVDGWESYVDAQTHEILDPWGNRLKFLVGEHSILAVGSMGENGTWDGGDGDDIVAEIATLFPSRRVEQYGEWYSGRAESGRGR